MTAVILLTALVAVAAIGSALVRPLARWALATMNPAIAVIVTSAASLAAALGLGISLSALAIAALAGWAPIAREGDVSTARLHSLITVPGWAGASATVLVGVLLLRSAIRTVVMAVAFWRSALACHHLPGQGPVVFTDDADIVTLAGLRGRIIVGRQLFDGLDAAEQRVVLAHEHSHLRRRHHLYVQAVELAAAANPLLSRVPEVVRLGIERWADEDAAAARDVADRHLTARALARVALARQRLRGATLPPATIGTAALAVAALQVSMRVRALLQPAPRFRASHAALMAAVAVIALAAGIVGFAHVDELIDMAQVHLPHRAS